MPSQVIANNFVIRSDNSASNVKLKIENGATSYDIILPTAPPRDDSALLFDGQTYVWTEVMKSIPKDSIPEGYENFQVFNTNILVQNSELHFGIPGGVPVRMQISLDGSVFFQKKINDEWIGTQIILDDSGVP